MKLAHLDISPKHIRELTQQVGRELAGQRDSQVLARRQRTLQPEVALTPDAVVVESDGGRLRTRQSRAGLGVHQHQNKEDKVAAFVTLRSQDFDSDPCPQPPPSFLDCRRVQRLVRQMQGQAADPSQSQTPSATATETDEANEGTEPSGGAVPREDDEQRPRWSPEKKVLTCVASMAESAAFGPMMAAEAQRRDFFAARKRAFVADGAAYNWSIQAGYFPDFEPIVDLLHVACYVYQAALAVGASLAGVDGWGLYARWFEACWQGKVSLVLAELRSEQERLGVPGEAEEVCSNDPREVVRETLVYLGNNACRMDYPRYRQSGLPTTSSLVESLVGEVNARVKDRRKFWSRPEGAELILQVRAAVLSEDGRLEDFFANRPGCPYRRRTTPAPEQQPTPQAA